ncbi:unnamed protein product [Effrenium voratum]|uniref:Uncharacterized protein n=1 Tax=Effrenium voratum TaxID=2562239 RepID=A0AA36NIH3_9DINO|nr:unnamed protein product [Effrenium voratum]CAJ1405126.1 unnamed protein product [Effrenium voratum]
MLRAVMEQDDGARMVDNVGLEQSVGSPARRLSSLGTRSFSEPVVRHAAEEAHHGSEHRQERTQLGLVRFRRQPMVPDVGGLGWRTKTGHLLKNQSFYPQTAVNTWDLPAHAGVNTWKDYHGPKMATDAEMMERLDRFDEEAAEWEAKKLFVNTTRAQTLDRFSNRKINRSMLTSQPCWAPHHRARREVHAIFETFDSSMGEKPQKELRKVYTEKVLKKDREAIRQIAKRIQNEETWKLVFKHMEQERRADIRADLQERQAHTDQLMAMSGQPLQQDRARSPLPNNCSQRSEELSVPRQPYMPKDVTQLTDFRGLVHADSDFALETLFPGFGHDLSAEFRAAATRSTEPGWPPPAAAATPRRAGSREKALKGASVTKGSIPVSKHRLERVGTRTNEDLLAEHSKAQFRRTAAPPAPPQSRALLEEDFSPKVTQKDPLRVTGRFARTEHTRHPTSPKAQEELPPPRRPMVYHVMVESHSPKASMGIDTTMSSMSSLRRSATSPLLPRPGPSQERSQAMADVCAELDDFDERVTPVPRISNFFASHR